MLLEAKVHKRFGLEAYLVGGVVTISTLALALYKLFHLFNHSTKAEHNHSPKFSEVFILCAAYN